MPINADRWANLPEDIQNTFGNASGPDWSAKVGEIWRSTDDFGIDLAVNAGNTHIILSEEETAAFASALAQVVDRWID